MYLSAQHLPMALQGHMALLLLECHCRWHLLRNKVNPERFCLTGACDLFANTDGHLEPPPLDAQDQP